MMLVQNSLKQPYDPSVVPLYVALLGALTAGMCMCSKMQLIKEFHDFNKKYLPHLLKL